MVVILNFHVPGSATELGRVLAGGDGAVVRLEPMVPGEEVPVPFLWIRAPDPTRLVSALRDQEWVEDVELVRSARGAVLVALEWDAQADELFHGITMYAAYLLRGVLGAHRLVQGARTPRGVQSTL